MLDSLIQGLLLVPLHVNWAFIYSQSFMITDPSFPTYTAITSCQLPQFYHNAHYNIKRRTSKLCQGFARCIEIHELLQPSSKHDSAKGRGRNRLRYVLQGPPGLHIEVPRFQYTKRFRVLIAGSVAVFSIVYIVIKRYWKTGMKAVKCERRQANGRAAMTL